MRLSTPLTTTHYCDGCLDTGYLWRPPLADILPVSSDMCRTRKEWCVGSRGHDHRSATKDCPWTTTIQCIRRTTDDTFTKAQHSPTPIRRRHSTLHHCHTNRPLIQALARMEVCVQDAKAWLCDNGFVMNDNKSQATVIRSSSLRTPTSLTRDNMCGQLVDTSPVIRDLGFAFDTNQSMTSQVANVCRSAYYHLSRIAKIRDSVSTTVCKSLIQCDTIRHKRWSPAPSGNGSAVCRSNCHVYPAARPAVHDDNTAAITLAACLKTHRIQATGTRAQGFIRRHVRVSLLLKHAPRRSLRSAGGLLLEVPRVNLERFGRRAFACAVPTLWNKLPRNMRDNGNLAQFNK